MGRLPAFPDPRDYTPFIAMDRIKAETHNEGVRMAVAKAFTNTATTEPEPTANNKEWLPPVREQGNLGSCVSFGWTCAMEFLHRRVYRRIIDFSQLFTYKMGRDLAGLEGDSGLWLKHGVGSLVRFGAPESSRYPYTDDPNRFDLEPPVKVFGYADDFRASKYFRLDSPKIDPSEHLDYINKYLYQKWPVCVGFYCFDTLNHEQTNRTGEIPFPSANEGMIGGHCVFLYGYDVNKEITNPLSGEKTVGAWRLRNSWSQDWGSAHEDGGGNGWIPFAYLTDKRFGQPLADEFYSITSSTWLNLQDFE
jgi:C1A family cysteine protease